MTQFEIEKTLAGMRGKFYRYKNEDHQVLRFSIGSVVKITTDRSDIVIIPDDFDKVVGLFSELPSPPSTQIAATGLSHQTVIGSIGLKLKNVLMDNIEEVKKNKDFAPQASAINETVKTIIDLAKVEIEMIKAMRVK